MATYMINCIHQMQSTLAVYEFTDKHIEMLAGQVSNLQNAFVKFCFTIIKNRLYV